MKKSFQKLMRRLQKHSGQSLVEYALILALIAVVAVMMIAMATRTLLLTALAGARALSGI